MVEQAGSSSACSQALNLPPRPGHAGMDGGFIHGGIGLQWWPCLLWHDDSGRSEQVCNSIVQGERTSGVLLC